MPKYLILRCVIISCFLTISNKVVLGQEAKTYFHKIAGIVSGDKNAARIFKRLDSLKGTRIPSRSSIDLQLNRLLDNGFHQQRINLQLNDILYTVNLLTRNDSVFFSIASTSKGFYEKDSYGYKNVQFDTVATKEYLHKRNLIYNSRKSVKDMKAEFALEKQYALYCGDGAPKTGEGLYIEKLVAQKEVGKLREMLQSINCETQAYGATGFDMLKKQGYKLINADKQMMKHIKERNTELITCAGCISGVIAKQYQ